MNLQGTLLVVVLAAIAFAAGIWLRPGERSPDPVGEIETVATDAAGGRGQDSVAGPLEAVEKPRAAPRTELVGLDGEPVRLDDYAGKVVMLNFWATWCPPCLKELPSMQRLWETLRGEEFVMLAVSSGEDRETVAAFVEAFETPLDFVIALDPSLEAIKDWPVFGLPTTFIVGRDGRLRYKALGEREWDEPAIRELLVALVNDDR